MRNALIIVTDIVTLALVTACAQPYNKSNIPSSGAGIYPVGIELPKGQDVYLPNPLED